MPNFLLGLLLLLPISALVHGQNLNAKPMDHEHSMVQVPAGKQIPGLSLALYRDPMSGFNLHLKTLRFSLEPPEFAGGEEDERLEGHAHVFINGIKVARLYGAYLHLPEMLFKPGINQIMVSLNNHQHDTWTVGSKMILSTLVIDPAQEDFLKLQFKPFAD